MALAINIDGLLNKQMIESNRIEFKKSWNPASIYRSVCTFANDFDDFKDVYMDVGIDTEGNRSCYSSNRGNTYRKDCFPER